MPIIVRRLFDRTHLRAFHFSARFQNKISRIARRGIPGFEILSEIAALEYKGSPMSIEGDRLTQLIGEVDILRKKAFWTKQEVSDFHEACVEVAEDEGKLWVRNHDYEARWNPFSSA